MRGNQVDELRILIIVGQFPPMMGGGGTLAYYLADALSQVSGIRVDVLTSVFKHKPRNEIINRNLTIHRVKFKHTHTLHYDGPIQRGLQLCKENNPNVIHGHHMDGSLIGLHLKASYDIPLVVTLHKTPMAKFDKELWKRNSIYSYMKLLSKLNMIDVFVAGSKAYQNELLNFGIGKERIKFIYHGIPIEWYKKLARDPKKRTSVTEKLDLKHNQSLLVCPTRIDEKRKGLNVFVRACGLLNKEFKEDDFLFLITGTPKNKEEKKYVKTLRNIAENYDIQNKLYFQSFKADEIPVLFSLAKVCVLPSIREGLGLVLLEALAVDTPVIGSNVLGIEEIIETNEIHGLKFQGNDHDDLFYQLKRILTDNNLVNRIKTKGYERLKNYFNSKIMAQNHIECYKEIIK